MHRIAITDDRRDGIQKIIDHLGSNDRYSIDIVASNGYELITQLQLSKVLPGISLMIRHKTQQLTIIR